MSQTWGYIPTTMSVVEKYFPEGMGRVRHRHARKKSSGGKIPLDQYTWKVWVGADPRSISYRYVTIIITHGKCWMAQEVHTGDPVGFCEEMGLI